MANPSILPTDALLFTDDEAAVFDELYDDAELDAICEALFPDELTRA